MVDISASNAFIVWLHLFGNDDHPCLSRRKFLISLGKAPGGVLPDAFGTASADKQTTEPPHKKSQCQLFDRSKDKKMDEVDM